METLKMTEKKINYQIINKDGEVVDDKTFNDYDKLADHMLELADKWYQGIYSTDDKVSISTFDETGNVIYEDTSSFGSNIESTESLEENLRDLYDVSNVGESGRGFGGDVKKSRKKTK
jgi:hypothetical protein